MPDTDLRAVALNCTLKRTGDSSTELLLRQVLEQLEEQGVSTELVRVAAHVVQPGVSTDEGDGDEWPAIRAKVLDADILVLGTPVWMGQPSSICKRVLERMDAFLSDTDDEGRMITYGRVAIVATVGNEDGAHHVAAETYQALSDVGFTIPASAQTYWVGEAMHTTDYQDLPATPEKTAGTTRTVAVHAAHLARLLRSDPYPPSSSG
jgi:multimeric flavodoxin WrbA